MGRVQGGWVQSTSYLPRCRLTCPSALPVPSFAHTPLSSLSRPQLQGPSYFTAALGLGHIANDPEDEDLVNAELHLIEVRHTYSQSLVKTLHTKSCFAAMPCLPHPYLYAPPRPPRLRTLMLRLVCVWLSVRQLPSDLPPRLKRLLPNAHFSDRLGPRLFTGARVHCFTHHRPAIYPHARSASITHGLPRTSSLLVTCLTCTRATWRACAVVLMASADLEASLKAPPIELFVSYGREPHRPGYPL
jgi:hypothetical protein